MIARLFMSALCSILLVAGTAAAQTMTVDQARQEGKAIAQEKRTDSSLVPSTDAQATAVPGYTGASQPQSIYYDDPDKLISDAQGMKSSSESYRVSTDADHVRPTFSNADIKATTNRATSVEHDPTTYLEGQSITSGSGTCTPLPPSTSGSGYYEATCNQGTKIEDQPRSCSVTMVPETTSRDAYKFFVVPNGAYGTPFARYDAMAPHIADGTCRPTGVVMKACAAHLIYGFDTNKFCNGYNATEYVCSANLTDLALLPSPITGEGWHAKTTETQVSVRRVDGCAGLAGDSMCTADPAGEVCTQGPETRIIDGVPITQPCWAWKRDFSCKVMTAGNDCGSLDANAACTYVRDDCLDDPQNGPCKVTEKVYRCPTPASSVPTDNQYICGDDVYCVNGECEPIVREASTEFRDALVGLHALDQAGKEFDETNYRVFSGDRETCHKPVFGLINCCAGKVSGAIPLATGAAALAGGPVAIAGLVTPFLVLFACSQDEMKLDIKDRMGLCHNLGSYCSSSFLGICSMKRTAYCCFESKLSRVLQEQGRPQLGKPWGSPKKESCEGFTVDEFARLDLSVMDFTDVYSDFLDAAKLPDEVQTMADIQTKIQSYYDLHGH
ncbi:conjugal transfer protein TraN [Sphingobium sp. B12D2B]|uniref:conjugal transfer protein TraN n=1 Tax=Sphingobium sp. B12D2B TaxID=2940577 RepID=UPI002225ADA5|nr:conjugal transfer protein TraN [Sphingobium sp. B12D2B]MCW2351778.1 conjugal transfer mating pair stabilization protein TraN [Sphingobium sp. B12D2B]